MAQRTQLDDASHPLHEAYACLLANGLDGAGEALRILVNEASRIERAQHLQATLVPQGLANIKSTVPELIEDASLELPGAFRLLMQRLLD
ncbi:MAG: hypothetical protein ACYCZL_13545, partial [Polaromonas sp.]